MTYAWKPQPGPQLSALQAKWCDELLFGGARGGGKSDYLLGDFLSDVFEYGADWRGVLFRRTNSELEELIARSKQLYPQTGAEWRVGDRTWVWPNGSHLKLRYLERTDDAARYQGHQYCVGIDTEILMGDRSSKPIKDIRQGEEVLTLSGPRKVLARLEPYEASCVKATNRFGSQIHPVSHPVISSFGWVSYKDCLIANQSLSPSRFARLLYENISLSLRPASKMFQGLRQELSRLLGIPVGDVLPLAFDGVSCEQHDFRRESGCLRSYLACSRFCDEQPLDRLESASGHTPLRGDVEIPCRVHYRPDVQGSIPESTPLCERQYEHPYTGQAFEASENSFYETCSFSPVGKRLVTDLMVEGVNHYISANTRLVNKNTWIGWDELTQWPNQQAYNMVKACLRSAADVPVKRIRCSANPGGHGHGWVKDYFIDINPLGYEPYDDEVTKMTRIYIPSRVQDNKILLMNDPDYVARLRGTGSPELVRAWLEGDWSVILGAYFPEFSILKHVVRPHKIPENWTRFRSFDWGSAKPFSVGWWAISDGTGDYPANALIRYREWYGAKGVNEGLKMTAEQVADGIVSRSRGEEYAYSTADTAIFTQDGGPSIGERMRARGASFRGADKQRLPGWDALRNRLIGHDDKPMIYFFDTCKDSIRTIPTLQHDTHKPEDVHTEGEDHAADEIRYACMSRPYQPPKKRVEDIKGAESLSLNKLFDLTKELPKNREHWGI